MTKFRGIPHNRYGKRHVPGQMTRAEEAYAADLQAQQLAGELVRWEFEVYTFKLADGCRYTPDFAVLFPDGSMEFVDTKGTGPVDDKSIVKAKCAAERFPQFRWVMAQQVAKKNGGGWKRREFGE